jgi:hypothetical protein
MLYIIKSDQRLDNGFFVQDMKFQQICHMFKDNSGEEDVDEMIEKVAFLDIGESFNIDFCGGNSYLFKRIG